MSKHIKESRTFRFNLNDGKSVDFPISKATSLKMENPTILLCLEKLKDGSCRLTYDQSITQEFKDIVGMEIIRN